MTVKILSGSLYVTHVPACYGASHMCNDVVKFRVYKVPTFLSLPCFQRVLFPSLLLYA